MENKTTNLNDEQLAQMLKRAGLRLTPQRMAIYRYMASTTSHPTAQQVYEKLAPQYPSLSLATVYNTLEALLNLGIINALGTAGDGAVHYDADTSPHVNLACVSCHQVIDLESEHVLAIQSEVAQNSGYHLLGARVMYYGLCPACQARNKPL